MTKYTVEDIQKPGFMQRFIRELNEFDAAGKAALEQVKKFDGFHKHRLNLEKIYLTNQKFTKMQQKAWDELEVIYISERNKRTELFQKFVSMTLERKIKLPDWVKDILWINT